MVDKWQVYHYPCFTDEMTLEAWNDFPWIICKPRHEQSKGWTKGHREGGPSEGVPYHWCLGKIPKPQVLVLPPSWKVIHSYDYQLCSIATSWYFGCFSNLLLVNFGRPYANFLSHILSSDYFREVTDWRPL